MSVVTALDALIVRLEYREPVRVGQDRPMARDALIVRMADEDGRIGLGEATDLPHPDAVATAMSWAVGRSPVDLHASGGPWALGLLPQRFCGALESAIADLAARQVGEPVARLLAGTDARVDVRVNALLEVMGPGDAAAATARDLIADGFDTLKVKLDGGVNGGPQAWWRDALVVIRDAVGVGTALRLDLNGMLTPDAAAEWLPTLVDLGLEYVEQPIAPSHGPDALAALRDTGVPLAADESVTDLGAALDLLEAGCDALVIKPGRVGGPLRAHAIVEAAAEAGVPVTISTLHETGVGLAAALHVAAAVPGDRAHGLATGRLLANDPVEGFPGVDRGRLAVRGPGLGVTLA
ncbi:MAG: mandelate racemase/muconate lactonizing enzyme family protein [Candidatus Limnocylindrales bacterium]